MRPHPPGPRNSVPRAFAHSIPPALAVEPARPAIPWAAGVLAMSMIVGLGWLCVVQSGSAGEASMRMIDPSTPTATAPRRPASARAHATSAQWVDPNAPPVLSSPSRSPQLLNTGVDKTPPQPPEPETSDDPTPPVPPPPVPAPPVLAAAQPAAPTAAAVPPGAPPPSEAVAAPAARPPVIPSRPPAAPRVMLAATQPAAPADDDGGKRWTVRGAPIDGSRGGRALKAEPPPKAESADARRARAAQDLAAKQLM